MKRLVVPPAAVTGHEALLTGPLHRHVVRVLRLGEGASLLLADGAGREVEGVIVRIEPEAVHVTLGAPREARPEPAPRLTLIYGLARGGRSDFVLQKATELGASRLQPAECARSMVKARDDARKLARWEEIVRQAARQCGRAHLPEVRAALPLARALDLPAPATSLRLVASPLGAPLASFEAALRAIPEEVLMVVGPEGGLEDAELALCERAGYRPVSLGPLILRTETAPLALLTLVAYLSGRWDR